MSVVKSQILEQLKKNYPKFPKKDLEKALDLVFDKIINSISKNNNVEIRGFGSLKKKINKAKFVRNPKTNEKLFKEKTHKIHFKISKILHKKINNLDSSP